MFDRFWMDSGSIVGVKLEQKSIENQSKNRSYVLNPTWTQLRAILVQLIGHLVPTWLNLEPTWTQLGPNLVLNRWDLRMLRSGCADDASNDAELRWQNLFIKFVDRVWNDFLLISDRFSTIVHRLFFDLRSIFGIRCFQIAVQFCYEL